MHTGMDSKGHIIIPPLAALRQQAKRAAEESNTTPQEYADYEWNNELW